MKINQVGVNNSTPSYQGTDAIRRPVEVQKQVKIENNGISNDSFAKSQAQHLESREANEEILSKSIEQANKSLEGFNRHIERAVHEVTHTVMYTLKDTKTNEVIMEFPPKKIQDMIAKMWELAGLFVDEKA